MKFLVPSLEIWRFPKEERENAWHLETKCVELWGYLDDFESALFLFDFCNTHVRSHSHQPPPTEDATFNNSSGQVSWKWQLIAARDGAMTIYHTAQTMEGIKALLRGCPTLEGLIDRGRLRAANKAFNRHFPNFKILRHAVAHSADNTNSREKFEKHSFSGSYVGTGLQVEGQSNRIHNCLEGRRFTTTYDGQIISYEMSNTTLSNLDNDINEFFRAFEGPGQEGDSPNPR